MPMEKREEPVGGGADERGERIVVAAHRQQHVSATDSAAASHAPSLPGGNSREPGSRHPARARQGHVSTAYQRTAHLVRRHREDTNDPE